MRKQSWTWLLSFTKLLRCLALVTSLWGCSAQYQMIPTAAGLPTSAQAERDAVLYAIPPDLRARLDAVVKEHGQLAENASANRKFVAQMPSPEMLFENKLLETVLEWAREKTTDERLMLQTRQMQAIPHYEVIKWTEKGEPQPAAHVEFAKGAAVGGVIGSVPLGPVIADVAIELRILPKTGYWARVGRTCGEFAVGVVQMGIGCAGISGGVGISGTGGGSVVGVPLVVGSYAILANGVATTFHALQQGGQLLREGPPPDADPPQPEIRLLEKPKAKPAQAPAAAPAKPAKAAQVETTTTTYDRTTKVTTTTTASGTTTVTRPRVKGKPSGDAPKDVAKGAKRGPKTDPDAPHNAARRKDAEKLKAEGNKIIAGGGEAKEKLVAISGGIKSGRRPDTIILTPKGERRGRNYGRTNADGTPVKREQEALDDLNNHSDTPTDFVPYDR